MAVIVQEEFKDILWVSDMGQLHSTESSIPINLIINRLIRRFKGSAFILTGPEHLMANNLILVRTEEL